MVNWGDEWKESEFWIMNFGWSSAWWVWGPPPRLRESPRPHGGARYPRAPSSGGSGPWDVKPEIQELEENIAQKRRAQKSNESSKTGTGWEAEEPRRTDWGNYEQQDWNRLGSRRAEANWLRNYEQQDWNRLGSRRAEANWLRNYESSKTGTGWEAEEPRRIDWGAANQARLAEEPKGRSINWEVYFRGNGHLKLSQRIHSFACSICEQLKSSADLNCSGGGCGSRQGP